MIAHTLGNPFDLRAVAEFARKHNLWLIEDCCDAVGATFQGKNGRARSATWRPCSFYPAHHITMGEGGACSPTSPGSKTLVESFRDWGRDCWCEPGKDNTCGKRFEWQLGDLPCGYDHKYIYSHIGYNLKLTDMQAAVGVAQLGKLAGFHRSPPTATSPDLHAGLKPLEELLDPARGDARLRPKLVRVPDRRSTGAPFGRNELVRSPEPAQRSPRV